MRPKGSFEFSRMALEAARIGFPSSSAEGPVSAHSGIPLPHSRGFRLAPKSGPPLNRGEEAPDEPNRSESAHKIYRQLGRKAEAARLKSDPTRLLLKDPARSLTAYLLPVLR